MNPHEVERIIDECAAAGVLEDYLVMVANGTSPRAAAMYALQSPAGTNTTDRAFCQGQQSKMENMSPMLRGMLQSRAKAAGINSDGKYFIGGLAERNKGPTDPAAWVSCAEDVLTIAKAKNLQVDGVLNRKSIVKDQAPPDTKLAPDIVNQLARKAVAADPSLRERCQKNKHAVTELKEKIVEKHSRKKPSGRQSSLTRLLKSSR